MKLSSITLTNEVFNAIPLDQRIELIRLEKRSPCFLTLKDYKFLSDVVLTLKRLGIGDFQEPEDYPHDQIQSYFPNPPWA